MTYVALVLASALYAILLHHTRRVWHPDWTWATVVLGVGLVYAGAYARLALEVPDATWTDAMQVVATAFLLGGLPVIIWQVGLSLWRIQNRMRDYRSEYERGAMGTESEGRARRRVAIAEPGIASATESDDVNPGRPTPRRADHAGSPDHD